MRTINSELNILIMDSFLTIISLNTGCLNAVLLNFDLTFIVVLNNPVVSIFVKSIFVNEN